MKPAPRRSVLGSVLARAAARHGLGPILPAPLCAAAILALTVWPALWRVMGLLTEADGDGLSRFAALSEGGAFLDMLWNSWIQAAGTAAASLFIGAPLAVPAARTDMPWKRLTMALAFVSPPWLTAMTHVYPAAQQRLHQHGSGPDHRRDTLRGAVDGGNDLHPGPVPVLLRLPMEALLVPLTT